MNDYIVAIIMGIVEGLTEFIPVSSTGHLIFTASLLGFTGEKADIFEVVIQLGAILAVFFLYRRKFIEFLDFRYLMQKVRALGKSKQEYNKLNRLTLLEIGAALAPIVVLGLLFHKYIKLYLFNTYTVIAGLVAGGIFMLLVERRRKKKQIDTPDRIRVNKALGIGLLQCLSLWPGFSRSGATIAGGMLLGLNRKSAAEFSFLLAVPAMFAASVFDLINGLQLLTAHDFLVLLVGLVVSFVVAYAAVLYFIKLVSRISLVPFALYRFFIAFIMLLSVTLSR